ncbi:hypothetical protein ACFX12_032407 [Malus domestica]
MRRPRPSKRQPCLPLPYLILCQVNRHINLREKKKDVLPHQSHFSKRSKGHYHDNQGYRHDNARPQAVNTMDQARAKIGPTSRYETYTPLDATCVAIYPSIAHLIPKPLPR